jgi:hypothetical protein
MVDLSTPEGFAEGMRRMRADERARFLELQRELVTQIGDDVVREEMQTAIERMEAGSLSSAPAAPPAPASVPYGFQS